MLEKEIIKLGLSDKEAKVYLAALELGSGTAQMIAGKAGVNRATTYVVIESLMKMGLMSTYDEGKKTFFTASPPEKLREFLENQESKVREKINILNGIIPELSSFVRSGHGQRTVGNHERSGESEKERDALIDSLADSLSSILKTVEKYKNNKNVGKTG